MVGPEEGMLPELPVLVPAKAGVQGKKTESRPLPIGLKLRVLVANPLFCGTQSVDRAPCSGVEILRS